MNKITGVCIILSTLLVASCDTIPPYTDTPIVIIAPNGKPYATTRVSSQYYPYTPYGPITHVYPYIRYHTVTTYCHWEHYQYYHYHY